MQSLFNIPDAFTLLFSFCLVSEVIEHTLTHTSVGMLSTFTLYLLYAGLTATTVAFELHFVATPFPLTLFHFFLFVLTNTRSPMAYTEWGNFELWQLIALLSASLNFCAAFIPIVWAMSRCCFRTCSFFFSEDSFNAYEVLSHNKYSVCIQSTPLPHV